MKFVYRFFSYLCDIVFPPSKDASLVRTLDIGTMRKLYVCRSVHTTCALSAYSDPRVRALVHEAKFQGNKKAYILLGNLLARYVDTITPPDYIIPIPLSAKRLRTRGYNQVAEVITHAIIPSMTQIRTDILLRTRDTRPQTELKRAERLVNLRDAFGVADSAEITGKHILIIDDVLTTGATLHAAKAALLPYSPASITCIALAH